MDNSFRISNFASKSLKQTTMSNWSRQQEAVRLQAERDRASIENLGKFFLDLAKLVFVTAALGGVVPLFMDSIKLKYCTLTIFGGLTTVLFAAIGYKLLKDK